MIFHYAYKFHKFQLKYKLNPIVTEINSKLISKCVDYKPDVVFVWAGVCIKQSTIRKIKELSILTTSYHADNPFGNYNFRFALKYRLPNNVLLSILNSIIKTIFFRRHITTFIKAIPEYDIHFVPRKENFNDFELHGAKQVHLMLRYYHPEIHKPLTLSSSDRSKYSSDVIFIGHYEPDHRIECLKYLKESGIDIKLFGTGWGPYMTKEFKKLFGAKIEPLYDDNYVKAINAGSIALCFMSKLNKDTSTTRCYEIPACGTLLLSERTYELTKELYLEDKEAVYFADKEELLLKVKYLLNNSDKRESIAFAGNNKCKKSGYDSVNRVRVWDTIVRNELAL